MVGLGHKLFLRLQKNNSNKSGWTNKEKRGDGTDSLLISNPLRDGVVPNGSLLLWKKIHGVQYSTIRLDSNWLYGAFVWRKILG